MRILKNILLSSIFGISSLAMTTNQASANTSCDTFLSLAANIYNGAVDIYQEGYNSLQESKQANTCANLEKAVNSFTTAFGGYGASVSHISIAQSLCKGSKKNTANQYAEIISQGYQQGAIATYLSSGLHYKSCRPEEPSTLTVAQIEKVEKELEYTFDYLDEVEELGDFL
jgi:hypothetical protein